ncbi:DinB family protein [Winogradskyella eckloniae]|uniref:DinB family protein n=1 Tax=Winogradskyella eckloniae TaxID=1089306 RepID=UPI001564AAD9|nr:DinB family protein [Winogradskyella eckloniae]NRD20164.1 DinB family protein [Winogradskyella eckloniae]
MSLNSLNTNEYNPYYNTYIKQSTQLSLLDGLEANLASVVLFFSEISIDKHNYKYEKDKWTIKEVLLHIIDTERIFAYRALRIARNDTTALPGFEQDDYVDYCQANGRTLEDIINEFKTVRQATISLFKSFSPEALLRIGTASDSLISVRAIGYIIVGHENHHIEVIKQRYL